MASDERGERVRRAVGEALPTGAPVGVLRRIERGWGNENWVGESARGRIVVKVGLPDANVAKWQSAATALELARAARVPAPELLAFAGSSTALDGRVLRVFSYTEGHAPETIIGDPTKRERFLRQLGEAVARLHRVTLPTFTSRIGTTGGFERWSDYVVNRWPSIVGRVEHTTFDRELLAASGAALDALVTRSDTVARPVPCHRDLYLDNLLCDAQGNLVAVLDFDLAEAWEPAADFHKLRWMVFDDDPEAERAFLAGYGVEHPLPADFDARIRLVEIIELVNGLAGWLARSDLVIAGRAEARLRRILSSPVPR